MKKLSLFPLLLACLAGCGDVKPAPEEQQTVICTLTAPENNAEIEIADGSFEIAGNALVNTGAISRIELKVGTDVVEEVTTVPFTCTYTLDEDQQAGELIISLAAAGDKGALHTAQVTVRLLAEPEDDGKEDVVTPQEVTVSLSAPADGSEWVSDTPLVISGDARLSKGNVSTVTLTVGDEVIEDVTEVPFTYEYTAPEGLPEGDLRIALEVVGDEGASATEELTVTHKKPEVDTPPTPPTPPVVNPGEMTDPRDGKVYKTVVLGEQEWMAENLAWLPEVYPSASAVDSDGQKLYFVLNYQGIDVEEARKTEEYAAYGVLYNWYAANDKASKKGADAAAIPSGVRGACPEGWHLPSKAEWQAMEAWVAAQLESVTGTNSSYETDENMKNVWSALTGVDVGWGESGMIEENPDLANGPRDLFGFCVKPAGMCWQTGDFGEDNSNTYFWLTDTQAYGGGCVNFSNSYYYLVYTKSGYNERRGYSVRCLKDQMN